MMIIKSFIRAVWSRMISNTKDAEPYFGALGWFLIISYIGFYFFNKFITTPGGYENLSLRIVVSLLGFFLLFYKYWPKYLQFISPIYFYCVLLLSFPFFFVFMLLHNQGSSVWQVNGLAGFILLALFVDWISFFILSSLGVGLAILFKDNLVLESSLTTIFTSYVAVIFYILIFSRKNKHLQLLIREMNEGLESKVKDRTLELNKALEVKTLLLSNISHEIRTPIQGFTVLSEGLVRHWEDFDEVKKFDLMNQVASNAKRLAILINNLLDLSKFSASKMLMQFEQIDLSNCINDVIDEYAQAFLDSKSIKIYFQSDEGACLAEVDEERIKQVLRNLISNAMKFSSANSVIEISLSKYESENERGSFYIQISDAGVGIPNDELSAIFDAFVQSTRTKTAAGGTGLGLSICKQIIDAHHGRIWASNNSDAGSTFHFVIPAKQIHVIK